MAHWDNVGILQFDYKRADSKVKQDTTIQYWSVDGKGITKKEFDEKSR